MVIITQIFDGIPVQKQISNRQFEMLTSALALALEHLDDDESIFSREEVMELQEYLDKKE